jgi:lipopolysaccharide biosynthesis glycosyltransferase
MKRSIYIGFDPREIQAYLVAVQSIVSRTHIRPKALVLSELMKQGLYTRPMHRQEGRLIDEISEHPMSTEFAISRFLVPYLAKEGWALFVDCDVLALVDLDELFALADPRYAVMCVKHDYKPASFEKMDGQLQSSYFRKNWSSVCLWNCDHPANEALSTDYINTVPGRVLHAFSWLKDEEIGELPPAFNYLVGETSSTVTPKLIHFTNGIPTMKGYETCHYSREWFEELDKVIPNFLRVIGTILA